VKDHQESEADEGAHPGLSRDDPHDTSLYKQSRWHSAGSVGRTTILQVKMVDCAMPDNWLALANQVLWLKEWDQHSQAIESSSNELTEREGTRRRGDTIVSCKRVRNAIMTNRMRHGHRHPSSQPSPSQRHVLGPFET
jgi:hypothetical protein